MLQTSEVFPYECKLGKNKVVKYRGWKTKDEKAYLILQETKDETTDDDFYKVLIEPCLENKNVYLTDDELQYLLIEIRKKSLGETFNIQYICQNEECGKPNEVDVNFKQIMTYKGDSVGTFKDKTMTVQFGDIKNIKSYKDKIKDKTVTEKKFIEMVMRIENITIGEELHDTFTFEEISDYIDNLDVAVYDKLLTYYLEHSSDLTLAGDFTCMYCNHENKFIFDEIPNFLAGW